MANGEVAAELFADRSARYAMIESVEAAIVVAAVGLSGSPRRSHLFCV